MLKNIRLLEGIGTFEKDCSAAKLELKQLTLIHAENGHGKTTLAAIMRSLASGSQEPILERHRLGSDNPPIVVLGWHDRPKDLRFSGGKWNEKRPEVKVFDDAFVDESVHSGLRVDPKHRRKLHEVILGDRGVALARDYEESIGSATELQSSLREKEDAISPSVRGEFSVKDFCSLPEIPDIDGEIEAVKRTLSAAENREDVHNTPPFNLIELPSFDIEAVRETLQFDLGGLGNDAEDEVRAHLLSLGEDGESWVEKGLQYVKSGETETCPFCKRGLSGLDLISRYRAYFNEGYIRHKREVARVVADVNRAHSTAVQASFQSAASTAMTTAQFWNRYIIVPRIAIDLEAIVDDWTAAREAVTGLLQAKRAAPLVRLTLDAETLKAVSSYDQHQSNIADLNRSLVASNEAILEVKREAGTIQIEELARRLRHLEATKNRYSNEIDPLCKEYFRAKQAKEDADRAKIEARNALEKYRQNVFPRIQSGINEYLHRFNAGFRIDRLHYGNLGSGSGSICTYNLEIGCGQVHIGSTRSIQEEPSFGSSLSAGDRNTLALSLFFSTIYQTADLSRKVIVIDDPISSLDFHRSNITAQIVSELSDRAAQVIVMSHSKSFLMTVWEKARHPKEDRCSLEIRQNGNESTFREWDVWQEYITEHDKRHDLLKEFYENQSGDTGKVARAIRPHLESYFRITCPDRFRHDSPLGNFLAECRKRVGCLDEVLSEDQIRKLEGIIDYANQFHHDKGRAPGYRIIDRELQGFVRDTLDFIRPLKGMDQVHKQHPRLHKR